MWRTLFTRDVSRISDSTAQVFQGNAEGKGRRFLCLAIVLSICMAICFSGRLGSASAGENEETGKSDEEIMEEIKEKCDSIVHIESICWDGESVIYGTKSFSGVVVTKDTAGIYIVTVQDGLAWTTGEKDTIRTEYELESTAKISEKIEVVFEGDLRIEASVAGESEQRNLSVLKLSQTVKFENILAFAEENTTAGERIYLLSFSDSLSESADAYNGENVTVAPGTVLQTYRENGNTFFEHDISTDTGSVGGPILNAEGLIAGILLTSDTDGDGTAVSAETIKEFLDTFEISYEEQEPELETKGIPILNLILGVIAGVLFLIVLHREWKSRFSKKGSKDREYLSEKNSLARSSAKKWRKANGKTSARNMGRSVEKSPKTIKVPEARLEYPAGKRAAVISKPEFVIGRIEEADFSLPGRKDISRRHASIQYVDGFFYLIDLHSVNHTFLNGQQLIPNEKYPLNNGDEIVLAKEQMIFYRKV